MSKSNKILMILIGLIAIVNVWLFFTDGSGNSNSYDRSLFAVADTGSVDQVKITSSDQLISLKRDEEKWVLNNKYVVDNGLRRLFFSILQRVSIRKPVDIEPSDSIRVTLEGGTNKDFLVFSNPTKTKTYFCLPSTNQSYEVEIPGYNEYLGGIFELSENQWRDRLIMDENWRSVKSLYLDYQKENEQDISITFNGDFFSVEGVSTIDSSAVVDYLNQFQVFEANEIISGAKFPAYDSLSKTTPIAALTVTSIKSETPRQLFIFPSIGNAPYQLVTNQMDELMIIDSNRVKQILLNGVDFQTKE